MQACPYCSSKLIIKKNFYFIKHSRSNVRRYLCNSCNRTFSAKTKTPLYRQIKPYLNQSIFQLIVSGNTQARTARLLNCSPNTVAKKLAWLSKFKPDFRLHEKDFLHLQIDEMETIEHTKLKPLTLPLCVSSTYKILGVGVGRIPAKGHLAEISRKKYGPRPNDRTEVLEKLLSDLKSKSQCDPLTITTDSSPLYVNLIKKYFPMTKHILINSDQRLKKKRELMYTAEQKKLFDPLFALNQRCAMLRSDLRRLTRRSWCTTKRIENLLGQLELYQVYNNMQTF
jgi:transposase-like protein